MKHRRHILFSFMAAATLLSLAACRQQNPDDVPVNPDARKIVVRADWSALRETPSGASALFYPEGAGTARTFRSNSAGYIPASIVPGDYSLLVFNLTEIEFGYLRFEGMDELSTATVHAEERESDWARTQGVTGRIVHAPDVIAAACVPVTETNMDSLSVKPVPLVRSSGMQILVDGITNVDEVTGYVTGLAGSVRLATGEPCGDGPVTQILDKWICTPGAGLGENEGYIVSSFSSFGPYTDTTATKAGERPFDVKLVVEMKLKDEQTVITKTVDLNGYMQAVREAESKGEIVPSSAVITTDADGLGITLPDVVKKSGGGSFFDNPSVSDWGDTVDFYVYN